MEPLYKMREDYERALAELDPEQLGEEAVADTLEGLSGELDDKILAVAAFVLNGRAEVKAMKEAEGNMATRRRTKERRLEYYENYLRNEMTLVGKNKVECPEYRVNVSPGQMQPVISDVDELPSQFVERVEQVKVDKRALLAELKQHSVPGAHLEQGKPRLVIK